MNKNYKKIIVWLLSLSVLFLILNFVYFKNESGTEQNIVNENTTTENESWSVYTNIEYNFSVQYPASLIYKEENSKKQAESDTLSIQPDYIVSFNDKESDFNVFRLSIFENTEFSSLEDWLKADNQLLSGSSDISEIERVIEKTIQIDGVDAFVTFVHNSNESDEISKHERKTVFIKNGDLFVISTRFIEDSSHEKIWKSFNFLQKS